MKLDSNPSMIFGLYCKPEAYEELKKAIKKDLKVSMREIRFIDVEIPLERKDEVINYFKHFIMPEYWHDRLNPLMSNFFVKQALKQVNAYKPVTFERNQWQNDNRHKLLWTLAVPLMVQDNSKWCETEKEKQAQQELFTFKSEGYKAKISGVSDD